MKKALTLKVSDGGLFVLTTLLVCFAANIRARDVKFESGTRIVFLGGTLAERSQFFGCIESRLQLSFPAQNLAVRNMGWSADEVGLAPRPLNFGSIEEHLEQSEADAAFLFFGASESYQGPVGIEKFILDYEALVARIMPITSKLIFISPIAHEKLPPPWPDTEAHNQNLEKYTEAIREMANRLKMPFVDLFHPTRTLMAENFQGRLTTNGIHLSESGYQIVSKIVAAELDWPTPVRNSDEVISELIVEKNRLFFLRWRPVNAEYIFGRRNKPFGVLTYPPEMTELENQVLEVDKKIQQRAKTLASDLKKVKQ